MEIGTDISKNMQKAIKAKLVELNSYVDDELPDYIMIMIANRKREEQMMDSLSLFLGNNTKVFTKWLYELLASLKDKKEDGTVIGSKKEDKVEEESKQSRWDEKGDEESGSGGREASEAVIDILPEVEDDLDLELYEGKVDSNKTTSISSSTATQANQDKDHNVKPNETETQAIQATNDYATAYLNHKKGISSENKKQSSDKTKSKTQKSENSIQDSRKSSKRKENEKDTSRKEKSKKLKRSRTSREEGSSRKRETSSKSMRDWDRSKADQDVWVEETNFKSQSKKRTAQKESLTQASATEDEPKTKRVSSSVLAVKHGYVSEESDDENKQTSVVSKVALPERRPRLPPNKQANRSLLLRAVCEAESSVKQSNKITSSVDEKQIIRSVKQRLGKIEKHVKPSKESSTRIKKTSRSDVNITTEVKPKKVLVLKRKSQDANRKFDQEDIKKTIINNRSEKDISQLQQVKKPKHKSENHEEGKYREGDKRRFVSRKLDRSQNSASKSNSIVHEENNMRVKFDQRNLQLKDSPAVHKDDEISLSGNESFSDEGQPGEEPATKNKKSRSSSPCFIVTLDGSVSKEKKNAPGHSETKPKTQMKQKFKAVPVKAPGKSDDMNTANRQTELTSTSVDVDDEDLSNMREKLIKMQEEARKLKSLQQEQLAAIKQTSAVVKAVTAAPMKHDHSKSIHVANVHFSANEKQISEHFGICGKVKRVTLLKDNFTGHPKGFAYLEFEEESCVQTALALDKTNFCGRVIRVSPKTSITPPVSPYNKPTPFTFRARASVRPRYRYTARTAMKTFRSRYRAMPARNKTWVKPGFVHS